MHTRYAGTRVNCRATHLHASLVAARWCDDGPVTATLVAKNVAGGFAHRTLFEGLDVTVAPGDVVGMVGSNGAGKSTLLRILAWDPRTYNAIVKYRAPI